MPDWNDILNEIVAIGSTYEVVRRNYLKRLHDITGRNIIIYYSGWLQKPLLQGTEVDNSDENGFMNVVHGLDWNKGPDLVLHPGGETVATESLVDYLRSMFGANIRTIVPQLTLSSTNAFKIIANHLGKAFIQLAQQVVVRPTQKAMADWRFTKKSKRI